MISARMEDWGQIPFEKGSDPTTAAWRYFEGVRLVCFLKTALNVDFDANPASSASDSMVTRSASPAAMRRSTSRTR